MQGHSVGAGCSYLKMSIQYERQNIASNHMQTATGVSEMSSCHCQEIQLRLLKVDLPIY